MKEFSIKGNLLIHFNNCGVIINEMVYKGNPNIYWNVWGFINIKPSSTIESLGLPKLKEYHFKNKLAIEILSTKTELHKYINNGLTAVIILIIIVILETKQKLKYDVQELPTTNLVAPDRQNFWSSLQSKGGGVMETTIIPLSTTTTTPPAKPLRLGHI